MSEQSCKLSIQCKKSRITVWVSSMLVLSLMYGCDLSEYEGLDSVRDPQVQTEKPPIAVLDVLLGTELHQVYYDQGPHVVYPKVADEELVAIRDVPVTYEVTPNDTVEEGRKFYDDELGVEKISWRFLKEGPVTVKVCTTEDTNALGQLVCASRTFLVDFSAPELVMDSPDLNADAGGQFSAREEGSVRIRGRVRDSRSKPNVVVNGSLAEMSAEPDANGYYAFTASLEDLSFGISHIVVAAEESPRISNNQDTSRTTKKEFDVMYVADYLQMDEGDNGRRDVQVNVRNALWVRIDQNFLDDRREVPQALRDLVPEYPEPVQEEQEEIPAAVEEDSSEPLFGCVVEDEPAPQEPVEEEEESNIFTDDFVRPNNAPVIAQDIVDLLDWVVDRVDLRALVLDQLNESFLEEGEGISSVPDIFDREEKPITLFNYELELNNDGVDGDENGPFADKVVLNLQLRTVDIGEIDTHVSFENEGLSANLLLNNVSATLVLELHGEDEAGNVVNNISEQARVILSSFGLGVRPGELPIEEEVTIQVDVPASAVVTLANVDYNAFVPGQGERRVPNLIINPESWRLPEVMAIEFLGDSALIGLFETTVDNFDLNGFFDELIRDAVLEVMEQYITSGLEVALSDIVPSHINFDSCELQSALHPFDDSFRVSVFGQLNSLSTTFNHSLLTGWNFGLGATLDSYYGAARGIPVYRFVSSADNFVGHAEPDVIESGEGSLQVALKMSVFNGLTYAAWNAGLLNLRVDGETVPENLRSQVSAMDINFKLPPLFNRPRGSDRSVSDLILSMGQVEIVLYGPGGDVAIVFGAHLGAGATINVRNNIVDINLNINDVIKHLWVIRGETTDILHPDFLEPFIEGEMIGDLSASIREILRFELPLPTIKTDFLNGSGYEKYVKGLRNQRLWLDLDLPRGLVVTDDYIVLDVAPQVRGVQKERVPFTP